MPLTESQLYAQSRILESQQRAQSCIVDEQPGFDDDDYYHAQRLRRSLLRGRAEAAADVMMTREPAAETADLASSLSTVHSSVHTIRQLRSSARMMMSDRLVHSARLQERFHDMELAEHDDLQDRLGSFSEVWLPSN